MGKADASITGCTFDDGSPGLNQATLLRIQNAIQGCAILYRATRILKFGLAKNVTTSLAGEGVEFDQRRFTNSLEF